MSPDFPPAGEWFCRTCEAKRGRVAQPPKDGIFASLFGKLEDKNSTSHELPEEIRDYYEGVKSNDEGEYEETGPPRTNNASMRYAFLVDMLQPSLASCTNSF